MSWHSAVFDKWEREIIERDEQKGCPVCNCKETGKFITTGTCGSTDAWYFCQQCGVMRRGL